MSLLSLWRSAVAFPLTVLLVASSFALSVGALLEVKSNGTIYYYLGGWKPPLGIEYVVDMVAGFVVTIITGLALLSIIATRRIVFRDEYGKPGTFYALICLLLAGLTGVVLTGDLFNLFVFMEIASLAGYALVFSGGKQAMIAGFRYLILGTVGGSFFLLGVGFLYFSTGTLNMADMSIQLIGLEESRAVLAGAVFIFVGLGIKMALFPMHLWLPDAYNYASAPVTAIIAPIMTKVAAYGMLRMFLSVFPDGYLDAVTPIAFSLVMLGLAGVIVGSLAAIRQQDLRRMLAHSSIAQLGLIAVGIGLASPLATAAALLHIMNHAVMKGCLFLALANMQYATGQFTLEGISGMARRMPLTSGAFALAAIAMVGVPPFAGFFSKWYLAQAGIQSGFWPAVFIVLLGSLLTAVYMVRVIERMYLSHQIVGVDVISEKKNSTTGKLDVRGHSESPADMVIPVLILAVASLVLGLSNIVIIKQVLLPAVGGLM